MEISITKYIQKKEKKFVIAKIQKNHFEKLFFVIVKSHSLLMINLYFSTRFVMYLLLQNLHFNCSGLFLGTLPRFSASNGTSKISERAIRADPIIYSSTELNLIVFFVNERICSRITFRDTLIVGYIFLVDPYKALINTLPPLRGNLSLA